MNWNTAVQSSSVPRANSAIVWILSGILGFGITVVANQIQQQSPE